MNKQELIDKWESKTGAPSYEISDFPINPSKIEMYIAGYGVARKEILEDLKQLDEPKKLILPKCAEQWIEGHCAPSDVVNLFIEVTCATDSDGFIDSKWRWSTDFYEWLANDADTLYILCDALRYGYEVEEEPLYTVTINLDLKYHLAVDEGDGNDEISTTLTTSHDVLGYRYFLTEKEIKSVDENLWLFAVPVEEVAEG